MTMTSAVRGAPQRKATTATGERRTQGEARTSARHKPRPGDPPPAPDVMTLDRLDRIGAMLYGKRWQPNLTEATRFDRGVIQRFMSGSQYVPDDLPERVREVALSRMVEVAETLPLLDEVNSFEAIAEVGKRLLGDVWKGELAQAVGIHASLLSYIAKGERKLPGDMISKLHHAVADKLGQLSTVLTLPGMPHRESAATREASHLARASADAAQAAAQRLDRGERYKSERRDAIVLAKRAARAGVVDGVVAKR